MSDNKDEIITVRERLMAALTKHEVMKADIMADMEERVGVNALDGDINDEKFNINFIISEFANVLLSHGVNLDEFWTPSSEDPELEKRWDVLRMMMWEVLPNYGTVNEGSNPDFFIVDDFFNVEEILVEVNSERIDFKAVHDHIQIIVKGGTGKVRFRIAGKTDIVISQQDRGPSVAS